MGNVCSGLSKSKEEKPHTVTLQAYNEIRIIPPTPSPGVITASSIPEYAPAVNSPDAVDTAGVIVKPPQKLAPLAEPETLSPAPPPKKEVTGAVVVPDSPDSDTEKLLSPNADDLTQDGVDSELLLDDTPATESPLATATAATTTTTKAMATMSPTGNAAIVVNGGFVGDDVPLTDAEMCDDSSSPPVAAAAAAADVVVEASKEGTPRAVVAPPASSEASEPAKAPSPSSPPAPIIIVNGFRPDAAAPSDGGARDIHSSHDHPSSPGGGGSSVAAAAAAINGDVTKDALIDSGIVASTATTTIVTTTTKMTTTTVVENGIENETENGLKTENIDVEIVENGSSTAARESSSVVDHNLNEQGRARESGRKDGHYFLEKTNNEENRIQTMCSSMEDHLTGELSDEAEGKIRVFIGKATLLTSKKFKQFKGLCKQNLEQDSEEAFKTTDEDLQGFWDLMMIQVEELDASYQDLLAFKSNNWTNPIKKNESKSANSPSGARRKGVGAKKSAPATPKSAEAEARSKAREEARRKLIAAKREAAKKAAKAEDAWVEPQENGTAHVNGDGVAVEADDDSGTGLRRKKSLSFTIP